MSSAISIKHEQKARVLFLEAQTTMPLLSPERVEGQQVAKHVEADVPVDSDGVVSELSLFAQCRRYL